VHSQIEKQTNYLYCNNDERLFFIQEHKNNKKDKQEKETIGVCPKCGSPIYEGEKNFYCSGYKAGCDFKLWKKIKVIGIVDLVI